MKILFFFFFFFRLIRRRHLLIDVNKIEDDIIKIEIQVSKKSTVLILDTLFLSSFLTHIHLHSFAFSLILFRAFFRFSHNWQSQKRYPIRQLGPLCYRIGTYRARELQFLYNTCKRARVSRKQIRAYVYVYVYARARIYIRTHICVCVYI